jgi:hypothetical protein
LIIGTGLHKSFEKPSIKSSPLCNWKSLLKAVSEKLSVTVEDILYDYPTIQWEQLITKASAHGYRKFNGDKVPAKTHRPFQIELEAKKLVADILKKASHRCGHQSDFVAFLNKPDWVSIISLNFDCAWAMPSLPLPAYSCDGAITGKERQRIYGNIRLNETQPEKRIWFPNGCIEKPASIRLGYRDFGTQIKDLQSTFNKIKAFERTSRQPVDDSTDSLATFNKIADFISSDCDTLEFNGSTIQRSWILDFLFSPLLFVGVGLSQSESGLWWLLTQRARNLARVPIEFRPPTIIIRREEDDNALFTVKPLGIKMIVADKGKSVSQTALDWADQNNGHGNAIR